MKIETGGFTYVLHPAGHVVRVESPKGVLLVDAPDAGPWDGLNDVIHGGLGAFGSHVALRVDDPFWRGARHVDSVHRPSDEGRDGWGVQPINMFAHPAGYVVTSSACTPEGVFARLRHDWRFDGGKATLYFTCQVREPVFVKEPKLCVSSLAGLTDRAIVLDAKRTAAKTFGLAAFTDPRRRTLQLTQGWRRHVELTGPNGKATVTAGDLAGLNVRDGVFVRWQEHAETAERLTQLDAEKPYCWDKDLRPSWELCRWPDRAGLLLHGWTGGVGFHDCRSCYRRAPVGTAYRVFLRVVFA